MGLTDKIANAKKTNWLTAEIGEAEIKTIVELAKISAKIEQRRIEMHMTQKQFAEYMGVSQGMVSKWESREYNFTIRSINEICEKLNLHLTVQLETPNVKKHYTLINWDEELVEKKRRKNNWMNSRATIEEAIA